MNRHRFLFMVVLELIDPDKELKKSGREPKEIQLIYLKPSSANSEIPSYPHPVYEYPPNYARNQQVRILIKA